MKKFLTREQAGDLISAGVSIKYASYTIQPGGRWDDANKEYLTWNFINWHTDPITNEDWITFGLGDLIDYINDNYKRSFSDILEHDLNWNSIQSMEDNIELIDYLYTWILNELEK